MHILFVCSFLPVIFFLVSNVEMSAVNFSVTFPRRRVERMLLFYFSKFCNGNWLRRDLNSGYVALIILKLN